MWFSKRWDVTQNGLCSHASQALSQGDSALKLIYRKCLQNAAYVFAGRDLQRSSVKMTKRQ